MSLLLGLYILPFHCSENSGVPRKAGSWCQPQPWDMIKKKERNLISVPGFWPGAFKTLGIS